MDKNVLTVEQLEERIEFTVALAGGSVSSLAPSAYVIEPIKCGWRISGSCSSLAEVDPSSINPSQLDPSILNSAEYQVATRTLLR